MKNFIFNDVLSTVYSYPHFDVVCWLGFLFLFEPLDFLPYSSHSKFMKSSISRSSYWYGLSPLFNLYSLESSLVLLFSLWTPKLSKRYTAEAHTLLTALYLIIQLWLTLKKSLSYRDSESVFFNSGQKMALRAVNVVIC